MTSCSGWVHHQPQTSALKVGKTVILISSFLSLILSLVYCLDTIQLTAQEKAKQNGYKKENSRTVKSSQPTLQSKPFSPLKELTELLRE